MGIYEPCPSEFTEEERRILESKIAQEGGCSYGHTFCDGTPHRFTDSDDGKTIFYPHFPESK